MRSTAPDYRSSIFNPAPNETDWDSDDSKVPNEIELGQTLPGLTDGDPFFGGRQAIELAPTQPEMAPRLERSLELWTELEHDGKQATWSQLELNPDEPAHHELILSLAQDRCHPLIDCPEQSFQTLNFDSPIQQSLYLALARLRLGLECSFHGLARVIPSLYPRALPDEHSLSFKLTVEILGAVTQSGSKVKTAIVEALLKLAKERPSALSQKSRQAIFYFAVENVTSPPLVECFEGLETAIEEGVLYRALQVRSRVFPEHFLLELSGKEYDSLINNPVELYPHATRAMRFLMDPRVESPVHHLDLLSEGNILFFTELMLDKGTHIDQLCFLLLYWNLLLQHQDASFFQNSATKIVRGLIEHLPSKELSALLDSHLIQHADTCSIDELRFRLDWYCSLLNSLQVDPSGSDLPVLKPAQWEYLALALPPVACYVMERLKTEHPASMRTLTELNLLAQQLGLQIKSTAVGEQLGEYLETCQESGPFAVLAWPFLHPQDRPLLLRAELAFQKMGPWARETLLPTMLYALCGCTMRNKSASRLIKSLCRSVDQLNDSPELGSKVICQIREWVVLQSHPAWQQWTQEIGKVKENPGYCRRIGRSLHIGSSTGEQVVDVRGEQAVLVPKNKIALYNAAPLETVLNSFWDDQAEQGSLHLAGYSQLLNSTQHLPQKALQDYASERLLPLFEAADPSEQLEWLGTPTLIARLVSLLPSYSHRKRLLDAMAELNSYLFRYHKKRRSTYLHLPKVKGQELLGKRDIKDKGQFFGNLKRHLKECLGTDRGGGFPSVDVNHACARIDEICAAYRLLHLSLFPYRFRFPYTAVDQGDELGQKQAWACHEGLQAAARELLPSLKADPEKVVQGFACLAHLLQGCPGIERVQFNRLYSLFPYLGPALPLLVVSYLRTGQQAEMMERLATWHLHSKWLQEMKLPRKLLSAANAPGGTRLNWLHSFLFELENCRLRHGKDPEFLTLVAQACLKLCGADQVGERQIQDHFARQYHFHVLQRKAFKPMARLMRLGLSAHDTRTELNIKLLQGTLHPLALVNAAKLLLDQPAPKRILEAYRAVLFRELNWGVDPMAPMGLARESYPGIKVHRSSFSKELWKEWTKIHTYKTLYSPKELPGSWKRFDKIHLQRLQARSTQSADWILAADMDSGCVTMDAGTRKELTHGFILDLIDPKSRALVIHSGSGVTQAWVPIKLLRDKESGEPALYAGLPRFRDRNGCARKRALQHALPLLLLQEAIRLRVPIYIHRSPYWEALDEQASPFVLTEGRSLTSLGGVDGEYLESLGPQANGSYTLPGSLLWKLERAPTEEAASAPSD